MSVEEGGNSYLISVEGETRTGLLSCGDFRLAEKRQHIIPKSQVDDARKFMGKTIWIKEYTYHKIYDRLPDGRPLDFKRPEEAVISTSRFGNGNLALEKTFVYTLTLSSGRNAYITKMDIEKSLASGVLLDNMAEIAKIKTDLAAEKAAADALVKAAKEKADKEMAGRLAEYQAQMVADLKRAGVTQGKTLWLKLPKSGVPGLTPIRIVAIKPQHRCLL